MWYLPSVICWMRLYPKRLLIVNKSLYVADRPGHDRRYAIDAGKISRELGWKPLETFESGIRKTVEWYLANTSMGKQC